MIRNIIFDWCGTLIDDLEAVWKATNRTFEQANVAPLTLEQFRAEFPSDPSLNATPLIAPRRNWKAGISKRSRTSKDR